MWHVSSTNDVIFVNPKKAKNGAGEGNRTLATSLKAGALPLSYTRKIKWSEQRGFEPATPGPKPGALPNCAYAPSLITC